VTAAGGHGKRVTQEPVGPAKGGDTPAWMQPVRREREQRWRRLEGQIRSDIAKLLRRLEKAVATNAPAPKKGKKTARRKPAGTRAGEGPPGQS
jgi:hypothetical protein